MAEIESKLQCSWSPRSCNLGENNMRFMLHQNEGGAGGVAGLGEHFISCAFTFHCTQFVLSRQQLPVASSLESPHSHSQSQSLE